MPVDRSQDRYGGRFSRDTTESGVLEGYQRAVQKLDKSLVKRNIEPYKKYGFEQDLKTLAGMTDAERFSDATKAVVAKYKAGLKADKGGGTKKGGSAPRTPAKPQAPVKPRKTTKPRRKVENVAGPGPRNPRYDPSKPRPKPGGKPPKAKPPTVAPKPPRKPPQRVAPRPVAPKPTTGGVFRKNPIVGGKAPLRV